MIEHWLFVMKNLNFKIHVLKFGKQNIVSDGFGCELLYCF